MELVALTLTGEYFSTRVLTRDSEPLHSSCGCRKSGCGVHNQARFGDQQHTTGDAP